MRKLISFIIVLASSAAFSATAADPDLNSFLKRIAREQPSIKWEAKSAVKGDFEGSHRQSYAVLGYQDKRVIVSVSHKAADGSVSAQYLVFRIGADSQDSFHSRPAQLETSPLGCEDEEAGRKLPGCIESPGASDLALDDQESDPIYMYWSHEAKTMVWWRH